MIAFLIDADNFSSPAWIDEAFDRLERKGSVSIRRAYGSAENLKGLAEASRAWAIRPFVNLPLPKNTTDMSLAVDAMELACMAHAPKTIVIGSGDLDFLPLVVRLRERGIQVICMTERGKLAQDAIPAYDEVIYVGEDQRDRPQVAKAGPVSASTASSATAKAETKSASVKTVNSRSAVAKKAVGGKASASKTTGVATAVTVTKILAALPNLKAGQWQSLGAVAKILHEEKVLAKSGTSTKLFKKFPHHFELMPPGKPNQVRYILPLS